MAISISTANYSAPLFEDKASVFFLICDIHHYSIQLLQTIFTTPLLSNLSTQN